MERSRSPHVVVLIALLLGAGLIVAGTFLPWTGDADFSPASAIFDRDLPNAFLLFAVAPLVAAAAAAALGLATFVRPERLTSGLLIGFGVQTLLLFLGYLGVSVFGPEGVYTFGIGSLAGVAGSALVMAGGLASLGLAEPAEATFVEPTAIAAEAPSAPAAGWYSDPAGMARLRYWSGERWTEQTQ